MTKVIPHAQEINVLNIDEIVEELLAVKYGTSKKGQRWITTSIRRDLTDEKIGVTTATNLRMIWRNVVTPREYRLMTMTPSVPLPPVAVLESDDTRFPWLAKAMERGDKIVSYEVTENTRNLIEHLIEVVTIRFPNIADVAKLDVKRVLDESALWQKELEREVELREGQISEMGCLDDEHEIVQLLDKQSYRREGLLMHHCVGSYDPKYGTAILSIRKQGHSVLTVELIYSKKVPHTKVNEFLEHGDIVSVVQVRGPKNDAPTSQMHDKIRRWLADNFSVRTYDTRSNQFNLQIPPGQEDLVFRFIDALVDSLEDGPVPVEAQIEMILNGETSWMRLSPAFDEIGPAGSTICVTLDDLQMTYKNRELTVTKIESGSPERVKMQRRQIVMGVLLERAGVRRNRAGTPAERDDVYRQLAAHTTFDPNRRVRFGL